MVESHATRLGEEAARLSKLAACIQARPLCRVIKTPGKLSAEAHKALHAEHGRNQTPYRYGRTLKDRPVPEERK